MKKKKKKKKENELLSWFINLAIYIFGIPILTFLFCFYLGSGMDNGSGLTFIYFVPLYIVFCIITFFSLKFFKLFKRLKKGNNIISILDEERKKEEKFYYSILYVIIFGITLAVTSMVSINFSFEAFLLLFPCYHCLFKFLANQINYFSELNQKYITLDHFPFKYWKNLLFFGVIYLICGESVLEDFNLVFNNTPLFFTFIICIAFFFFFFLRKYIEVKVQNLSKEDSLLLNLFNFLSFLVLFPLMAFLITLINSSIFNIIEAYISKVVAIIFFGILIFLFVYFTGVHFVEVFKNKNRIIKEMNSK